MTHQISSFVTTETHTYDEENRLMITTFTTMFNLQLCALLPATPMETSSSCSKGSSVTALFLSKGRHITGLDDWFIVPASGKAAHSFLLVTGNEAYLRDHPGFTTDFEFASRQCPELDSHFCPWPDKRGTATSCFLTGPTRAWREIYGLTFI